MIVNKLICNLSALTISAAILFLPPAANAAQVAKSAGAKDGASKTAASKDDKAIWQLAGRDGDCAPLSLLEKKGAEYKDVKSPYQLAEKLRAAGHKADLKEFKAGSRPAVEVRAPDAGIHVMFVKKENCDKKPPAPGKK